MISRGMTLLLAGYNYCARMLSEQHGTVFTGEHYEKIQKIYSIWSCPSVAESRRNSMFRYHTIEESDGGKSFVSASCNISVPCMRQYGR